MLLMIHGISQQKYIGKEEELRNKWAKLLRKGLEDRGASGAELSEIVDSSVMLFYADLTDPAKVHAPADSRAVGVSHYESLIRQGLDADDRAIHNWRITHLLAKWGDSFPLVRDALIKCFAEESYGYFDRPAARQEVDARCDSVVGDKHFKLMLTHSFGGVVGYRLLSRNRLAAKHLITMGTPLGIPFMMGKMKVGAVENFRDLNSWDDYSDPDDLVSYAPIEIRRMFKDYTKPPAFSTNRQIDNETENQHSIEGYIMQPKIADRILEIYRAET